MTTAANITEQAANPTPEQKAYGGPKKSAEERIAKLIARVKSSEEELAAVRQHNDDLLYKLASYEIAETARQQGQQAAMDAFIKRCDAVSKVTPGFDACLRRLADVPASWLNEIARHPNGPGLVAFLGTEPCAFLNYLLEVKEEVAIQRLRQAGYDMHHKLPQFAGGVK